MCGGAHLLFQRLVTTPAAHFLVLCGLFWREALPGGPGGPSDGGGPTLFSIGLLIGLCALGAVFLPRYLPLSSTPPKPPLPIPAEGEVGPHSRDAEGGASPQRGRGAGSRPLLPPIEAALPQPGFLEFLLQLTGASLLGGLLLVGASTSCSGRFTGRPHPLFGGRGFSGTPVKPFPG